MRRQRPEDPHHTRRLGRRGPGLLGRLVLALVMVALVPLAVVTADRAFIQRSLRKQVLQSHSLVTRSTAERVAAFFAARRALGEALARNPSLTADPASTVASELLAGALQAQPEVAAVSLADLEGREFLRAQRRQLAGVADHLLAGPSDRLLVIESVPSGVSPSGVWMRVDTPFAGGGGVVRQVVATEALAEVLLPPEVAAPLAGAAEDLGAEAEIYLSSLDGSRAFRGRVAEGGEPRLAEAGSLEGLPASLLEKALSGRISGVDGEDEEVLGAYSPVAGGGWVVISAQPRAVAEAVAERMRRVSSLALGGALLLAALTVAAAYGSVVKPIRRLVGEQRRLAGLSRGPGAGSEIEQLEESFSLLERRIHDQQTLGEVFLGRYQVLAVLGEGGMGMVFRGWDPKLQRAVALKTVRLDRAADRERRRDQTDTLLREAVAAARISHPHVVAVYDVLDQGDVAFISMELVEGISLADYLWQRRRLPPEEAVTLALAVAEALQAAHRHGIVHRDVKPGNVLLGWSGDIKVVDFGLARLLSGSEENPLRVFGTPGYLPPEALAGQGHGPAGDLFSLGVILYECLTGQQPFAANALRATIVRTLRDEPQPPSRLEAEVQGALEDLVLRLLTKDPAARLGPAAAVVAELKALPRTPWSLEGIDRENSSMPAQPTRSRLLSLRPGERVA